MEKKYKGVHYGNISHCFKTHDPKDPIIRRCTLHLVLNSLFAHFNQFEVSYNCQKEKWSLNEPISFCV